MSWLSGLVCVLLALGELKYARGAATADVTIFTKEFPAGEKYEMGAGARITKSSSRWGESVSAKLRCWDTLAPVEWIWDAVRH